MNSPTAGMENHYTSKNLVGYKRINMFSATSYYKFQAALLGT